MDILPSWQLQHTVVTRISFATYGLLFQLLGMASQYSLVENLTLPKLPSVIFRCVTFVYAAFNELCAAVSLCLSKTPDGLIKS